MPSKITLSYTGEAYDSDKTIARAESSFIIHGRTLSKLICLLYVFDISESNLPVHIFPYLRASLWTDWWRRRRLGNCLLSRFCRGWRWRSRRLFGSNHQLSTWPGEGNEADTRGCVDGSGRKAGGEHEARSSRGQAGGCHDI